MRKYNFYSNGHIDKESSNKAPADVVDMYRSLLMQRGIHIKPMTELSFNTLYKRYKQLGGKRKFEL